MTLLRTPPAAGGGGRVVIGKQAGLDQCWYKRPFSGTRPCGDSFDLPYLGNSLADRMQNITTLRETMAAGRPIRR